MRGRALALWTLTGLLAALYLFAGSSKLAGMSMHVEHFQKWGYPDWFRVLVGGVEVVGAVALLLPRTAFYAAVVLAVEMAGAVYTHLTHNEAPQAVFPAILVVLLAAVAYLRRPVPQVA